MFTINIISQSANYSAEQVFAKYIELLRSEKWHGWRCGFNIVQNQDNPKLFTISGGKAKLPKKEFEFVTIPLSYEVKIENQEKIEKWATEFDILLEVADLSIMEDETAHKQCGDAFHALKMTAKRDNALILMVNCQEVIEQITTTQKTDFEQYTNIYQGLHSAVCGQKFREIKPQEDKAGKVRNFFNDHFYTFLYDDFRTELGNKFYIKPQTYFNHNDLEFSGYIESFFAIMQELYKAEHPHGLEINNIINNKIYNIMSKKNFSCRLFGKKEEELPTIRLAVIAYSDQGKTFLLQDIINSLREMGEDSENYRPEDPNSYYQDGNESYASIDNFSWATHKALIGQTLHYVARQDKHYQSCMTGGDNPYTKNCFKNFNFEFMDIPGEIFLKNSLIKFQEVRRRINKTKGFVVETWEKDGNKKLLVRYKDKKTTDYKSITKAKKDRYLSFNEYTDTLKGYTTKDEDNKNISGKELWNRFYEFETDTAISAMYEYLLTENINEFSDEFNSDENEQRTPEQRKEIFLNNFYFFYFCYNASDVIICDRIGNETKEQDSLLTELQYFFGTNSSKDKEVAPKKRFYLVFRGLDTLIKTDNDENPKLIELFTKNCNALKHEIYCYLYYMLNEQLKQKQDKSWKLFADSKENPINLLISINYEKMFVGFDKEKSQSSTAQDNILPTNCADIFDNSDNGIWKKFDNKIDSFKKIKTKKDVTENYQRIVPLFPHIYFTGYPITNSLIIAKNGNRGEFTPKIEAKDSLRLGVNELVIDMLYRNLPKFKYYDGKSPYLMQYMFGQYTGN